MNPGELVLLSHRRHVPPHKVGMAQTRVGPTGRVGRRVGVHTQRWPIEIVNDPKSFIAALPVVALEPSSDVALLLQKWGMALIRDRLPKVWRAVDLRKVKNGEMVQIAGQVICRQRPSTAKGVCFVSLEDETGISNAIVAPGIV